jgi:hypothetical protein
MFLSSSTSAMRDMGGFLVLLVLPVFCHIFPVRPARINRQLRIDALSEPIWHPKVPRND